ncbi:MAG: hypothetical protein JSS72_02930 [Armatimonadetes bacterium]|nr:hypothetical protein [Armatimonadota bacterium]
MVNTLLLLLLARQSVQTLEIEVGPPSAVGQPAVWGADTTLDSEHPDQSTGGEYTLTAGPGKPVLIKFLGLNDVTKGKEIVDAELVFHLSSNPPHLARALRMLKPWGEGPLKSLGRLLHSATAKGSGDQTLREASTFTSRRFGPPSVPWQLAGANGNEDAEVIGGISGGSAGPELYAIKGLGPSLERMRAHWWENEGYQFRFEEPAEFYSCQAPTGFRPYLKLTLRDAAQKPSSLAVTWIEKTGNGRFKAHVMNNSSTAISGWEGQWVIHEKPGIRTEIPQSLAPGAEWTEEIQASDDGNGPIRFVARWNGDSSAAEIEPNGAPITVAGDPAKAKDALNDLNHVVFPFSRFSFALNGVTKRVRIQAFEPQGKAQVVLTGDRNTDRLALLSALGLKPSKSTGDATYAGILGEGDTRFEGLVPSSICLPSEPISSPIIQTTHPEPSFLLSARDVGQLNGLPSAKPTIVLLRPVDSRGEPFIGANLTITDGHDAVYMNRQAVKDPGVCEIKTLPGEKPLLLTLERGGEKATATLPAWRLSEAAYRGNTAVAILDCFFNLPLGPVDRSQDLATKAIATVSDPQKAGIDMFSPNKAIMGKDGLALDFDLNRDRAIGEVVLKGIPWKQFDIYLLATGDKEPRLWVQEFDSSHRPAGYAYHGRPMVARVVRILPRTKDTAHLTGISVYLSPQTPDSPG